MHFCLAYYIYYRICGLEIMPTATLVADGQATALESKAAQNMSELQKARLEHALEIPDVLLCK